MKLTRRGFIGLCATAPLVPWKELAEEWTRPIEPVCDSLADIEGYVRAKTGVLVEVFFPQRIDGCQSYRRCSAIWYTVDGRIVPPDSELLRKICNREWMRRGRRYGVKTLFWDHETPKEIGDRLIGPILETKRAIGFRGFWL